MKIDIDEIIEKVGQQLTIGDQRTVRLVLEAVNDQLSDCKDKCKDISFCIYNKSGDRMFQYGIGDWCMMNRVLRSAEKDYPNAGFYVGETEG